MIYVHKQIDGELTFYYPQRERARERERERDNVDTWKDEILVKNTKKQNTLH